MYTIFRLLTIATIYGDKRMLGKQKNRCDQIKKNTERLGAQKAGSGSFEQRCGTSIFSDGSSSCFYFNKQTTRHEYFGYADLRQKEKKTVKSC